MTDYPTQLLQIVIAARFIPDFDEDTGLREVAWLTNATQHIHEPQQSWDLSPGPLPPRLALFPLFQQRFSEPRPVSGTKCAPRPAASASPGNLSDLSVLGSQTQWTRNSGHGAQHSRFQKALQGTQRYAPVWEPLLCGIIISFLISLLRWVVLKSRCDPPYEFILPSLWRRPHMGFVIHTCWHYWTVGLFSRLGVD